jgi:hypothetical protein
VLPFVFAGAALTRVGMPLVFNTPSSFEQITIVYAVLQGLKSGRAVAKNWQQTSCNTGNSTPI